MGKASDTFRHPVFKHNCAQAIAAKWIKLYNDDNIVEKYKDYTGGRNEDDFCSALYAATKALPEKRDEIIRLFTERATYTSCRELKQNGKVPCKTCVDIADEILEKLTKE